MTTPRAPRLAHVPAQRMPVSAPRGAAPRSGDLRWQRRYATLARGVDLAVVTLCVAIGVALGSGLGYRATDIARLGSGVTAWVLIAVGLSLSRAWEPRVLGAGTAEPRRVTKAFAGGVIGVGLAGLAFDVVSVKPWVFGVMPAAWALCLAGRYALRKLLHHERQRGRCRLAVLAVGTEEGIADLVRRTRRDPFFGWSVAAACTSSGTEPEIEGVPVIGDLDTVAAAAHHGDYQVVAVSPAPGWAPAGCSAWRGSSRICPSSWPSTPASWKSPVRACTSRPSTGCRCCVSPSRASPAAGGC